MSTQTSYFVSKAGTYDALIDEDGVEHEVFIVGDSPTVMVVEVVATGETFRLGKAAQ